jgi:hypothetical protein
VSSCLSAIGNPQRGERVSLQCLRYRPLVACHCTRADRVKIAPITALTVAGRAFARGPVYYQQLPLTFFGTASAIRITTAESSTMLLQKFFEGEPSSFSQACS